MSLDHEAIYRAYPNAVSIEDAFGAFDKDNKLISLEQSKIDVARTTINTEQAAVKYKTDRTTNGEVTYPSIGDQLDNIWHCIDADADLKIKFKSWYDCIKDVKDSNPKPS